MKIQRIDLRNWELLRTVVFEAIQRLGAPASMCEYMRERVLNRKDDSWSPYDNGWRNPEYAEWDKKASGYAKSVPVPERGVASVAGVVASCKLEIEVFTDSSQLNHDIGRLFLPLQADHSQFGLMSVRNDAVGEALHAMATFNSALLRSQIDLTGNAVGTLVEVTTDMARFRTANRLLPEYFPFGAVLRQLKKQAGQHLAENSTGLERLQEALADLPFDDGESRRARLALQHIMVEIQQRAQDAVN